MPIVRVNDVKLYYETYGQGEALLLIAGIGYGTWLWAKQIPELSKYFSVIAFDNRGVGRSDKPDIEYTVSLLASDTYELLRALGVKRAHILGISLGGFIAQQLALDHPEMANKLILCSTSHGGPNMILPKGEILQFMAFGAGKETFQRGIELAFSTEYLAKHPEEIAKITERMRHNRQPRYAYLRQFMAPINFNSEPLLHKLTMPVLVMAGEADCVVPVENSRLLAEKLPNAQLVTFPGAGHLFVVERADEVNRIIIDFLKGVLPMRDYELSWVGDWSGRRAMLTPTREALYDAPDNRRFTYAELDERANRVGTYLIEQLGLRKGDTVSFISRNRVEPIDLYFATGKIGLILAPLSYRLGAPELNHLLSRIQPKAFFYEEHFQSLVEKLEFPKSVKTKIIFGPKDSEYERVVLQAPPKPVNRPKSMNEIHLYIHTGGTTGLPKICLITYRQMLWNSFNMMASGGGQHGINQKELLTFPLFHIGGWNTVTPVFHIGGHVTLIREFNPDLILELIERERITHFGGVEAMLRMIANSLRFAQTDLSSLEYVSSAGAPCSAEVMRPFWERGIKLTQSYGLTEGGPSNFFFVPVGRDWKTIKEKSQSIGFPMFHCDCKIVDPKTGQLVAVGEIGELWFRGPHTFEGYLNDPEKTQKVLDSEGWVHSGDLARQDEDGFVYIVGRVDDMYISGGENISPEEVERALIQHPAIAQVAVVGVPDEQWGQVGLAAIVLKPGASVSEDELKRFCREHLGGFRVPKYFKFVKELPLSGPGKINRKILRERFAKGEL